MRSKRRQILDRLDDHALRAAALEDPRDLAPDVVGPDAQASLQRDRARRDGHPLQIEVRITSRPYAELVVEGHQPSVIGVKATGVDHQEVVRVERLSHRRAAQQRLAQGLHLEVGFPGGQ